MTDSSTFKNKDEKIGFHKGALDTLLKERSELYRLLVIVDQLIKIHTSELKKLGVDINSLIKEKKEK